MKLLQRTSILGTAVASAILLAACSGNQGHSASESSTSTGPLTTSARLSTTIVPPGGQLPSDGIGDEVWFFGLVTAAEPLPGYGAEADPDGYRVGPIVLTLDDGQRILLTRGTLVLFGCDPIPTPTTPAGTPCYVTGWRTPDGAATAIRVLSYGTSEVEVGSSLSTATAELLEADTDSVLLPDGTVLFADPALGTGCDGLTLADLEPLPSGVQSLVFVLDPRSGSVIGFRCKFGF